MNVESLAYETVELLAQEVKITGFQINSTS